MLLAAAALHACNDAFFYVLYPLLPFIATELGLPLPEISEYEVHNLLTP